MNRQLSATRAGIVLGIALCGLLAPAPSWAATPAGDPGANTGQAADEHVGPSPLHQDENHWRLRFNLAWVNPAADSVSTSARHNGVRVDVGAGVGAGLQAEYRTSPRLGIELGLLGAAEFDFTSNISGRRARTDVGLTSFAPFSLGLNFHLTPEQSFDLYAGPQVALVSYSTDRVWVNLPSTGVRLKVENDWAWGLAAGIDLPLGKRGWLFNANLCYLDTDIGQSGGDFHFGNRFDPVILSVGFGYAF